MACLCGGPRPKRVIIRMGLRVRFLVGHVEEEDLTRQWKFRIIPFYASKPILFLSLPQILPRTLLPTLPFCTNFPSYDIILFSPFHLLLLLLLLLLLF